MGTNFYLRKKVSKEVRRDILNFIRSKYEDFNNQISANIYGIDYALDDFEHEVRDCINQNIIKIHLGKRSFGWQFLWNYHGGRYYSANFEDIKSFISNPDYEIIDEYGRIFTVEQFLNEEIGPSLYNGKNGLEDGPNSYFFISDNLRFSTSENFA